VQAAETLRLVVLLREFRAWLEAGLFGDRLEAVAALESLPALLAWSRGTGPAASDFGSFLRIAEDLELWQHGRATDVFMSYGAYPQAEGRVFPAGLWDGQPAALDPAGIREDASHAWLADERESRHPADGQTLPLAEKPGAYSWCKAPRMDGRVVEVGALARQVVAGHPLARDLVARHGGNVFARVVLRLVEIARLLPEMEQWLRSLDPGGPYCLQGTMPDEAQGVGLVEAARGSLGHWLSVRQGRLTNYQIIAPTTWNFSPRDRQGKPGALEQALRGLPAEDPVIHHVVRSFDPCMVCTVH
jgi:hydrogenase large subunit